MKTKLLFLQNSKLKEFGVLRFIYIDHKFFLYDKTAVPNEEKRRLEEVTLNNEHNKDIMFLRNHYLHWNSVWGELGLNADIVTQPHHPNMIAGKRKRETR